MKLNFAYNLSFLVCCFFVLMMNSAFAQQNKAGIEAAMKYYDHLIQKLDADSIALLYTPDGKLGSMATGRDSIRRFLSSFKNVQVLWQQSTSDFITMGGDTAVQKGFYTQRDVVGNKDTINVKGEYTAIWQWITKGGWRIKRMDTKPVK